MKPFILAVALCTTITAFSQNLVKNPSFENRRVGGCLPENSPAADGRDGLSFSDCLGHWNNARKDMSSSYTWHSPDWYQGNAFGGAQEGSRFVHMVNYEAIQQKMFYSLNKGEYYSISLWVKLNERLDGGPRYFGDAALNVYFGRTGVLNNDRLEYEWDQSDPSILTVAGDDCDPKYRNLRGADRVLAKQFDLSGYPLNEWIQLNFIYYYDLPDPLSDRDIVAFELIDTDPSNNILDCTRSSICLDNVKIINACQHPCVANWPQGVIFHPTLIYGGTDYVEFQERVPYPDLEPILFDFTQLNPDKNTPLVKIDIDTKNTVALVQNAHKIRFEVFSRSSSEVFEKVYFDPNYLKNTTFNSARIFGVTWNGENNNGIRLPNDVYVGKLTISTCQGYYEEFLFLIQTADGYPDIQPYPIPWNPDPLNVNCCEPGGLVISSPINNVKTTKEWVISMSNGGKATSGGNVKLISGQGIEFEPGSEVELGASFECYTKECDYGIPNDIDPGKTNNDRIFKESVIVNEELSIYPNPTDGKVVIESNVLLEHVTISSLHGRQLDFINTREMSILTYDVSSLESGIYLFTIKLANGLSVSEKVIVK